MSNPTPSPKKKAESAVEAAVSGVDPYEIEWPDDAKELRESEREEAAKKAAVKPAAEWLTASVIGASVVLVFLAAVSIAGGAPGFVVAAALPVVVGTALALPIFFGINAVTKPMIKGIAEAAHIFVGGAIGLGLGYAIVTLVTDDPATLGYPRAFASVFSMTMVATAFALARFGTGWLRMRPRVVYGLALAIGLITLGSIFTLLFVSYGG